MSKREMIKRSVIFKTVALLQVVFLMIPLVVSPAKADTISNPDAFVDPITQALHNSAIDVTKQAMEQIMEDFGIGEGPFKELGETANVGENKNSAPEVQLMFSPSSPKVAEKITATALPQYFSSMKENLYFTWYLKHAKCKTTTKKGSSKYVAECDLNYDDLVNIEDYKIEAMREIATNGFDKNKANYSTNEDDEDGFSGLDDYVQSGAITDEVCDGLEISLESPLPTDECDGGTEVEEDIDDMCANAKERPIEVCTKAPFGGFNNKQPTDGFRCYVKDYEDGKLYEIVEPLANSSGSNCPEVHRDEESNFTHLNSEPCDSTPESNGWVCSKPIVENNPTFDQNGGWISIDAPGLPLIHNTQPGQREDTGRIWIAYVFDGAWYIARSDQLSYGAGYGKNSADIYICDPEGPIPEDWVWGGSCNEEKGVNCYLPPVGEKIYLALTDLSCTRNNIFYPEKSRYGCDLIAENTKRTSFVELDWNYAANFTSEGKPSICTHLFPHATYEEDDGDYERGDTRFVTGDGVFDPEEERFWETNPEDPDTAGDGIGDEAALAGVGRDKFTWTYNTGDQVGVAVEGVAMNSTKHADSSHMIMWALPKNTFDSKKDYDPKCKIKNKGSYTKTINDRSVQIDTAEIDINACLEANLVDPLESPAGGAPAKNLEVDLSYSPAKPFNDSENSRGSNVIVQSTITNSETNDSRDVYYRWTVFGRSDTDFMGDWGNSIESDLDMGVTEGLNKDSISFSLNLDESSDAYDAIFGGESQGYIKIVLDVEENYGSSMTKSGKGEKIFKVTTGDDSQMNVFEAQYSEGKLTIDSSDSDSRLCLSSDGSDDYQYCPVIKNLIVGVQLDVGATSGLRNFSWTLNGEPLECTGEMSSLCSDTSQRETVFFAITGEEGETYTLTAVANDVDPLISNDNNQGKRLEINKMFQVVEPSIKLGPSGGVNEETCESAEGGFNGKDMGDFKDIRNDGELVKECSNSTFNAQPGTFNIQADFFPSFLGRHIREAYENTNLMEDEKDNVLVISVDGEKLEGITFDEKNSAFASYDAGGSTPGDTIRVSASGEYSQSREIKRLLNNVFKVSQFNFSNTKFSDAIRIKIEEIDVVGVKKKASVMASLMSNLPIQMLFLFRVMLTVGTVIFISGTVFALGKQDA